MLQDSRQIFGYGLIGEKKLKETLSDLMVGLILCPEKVWLVSPWVTDFDLLDNRSGDWDSVNPAWGCRHVAFSELLIAAIEAGCDVRIVTNDDNNNHAFLKKLYIAIGSEGVAHLISDPLHTKGLLSSTFFLSGSMNFTYSGLNRNDELVTLTTNSELISSAKIEFEDRYRFHD